VVSAGDPLRGSETILLAFDARAVRSVLAGVLRQYGYHVLEASDLVEAQRLAKSCRKIRLLLMDLFSPENHPLQLAQWFRATYPNIKVLVASDAVWELYFDLDISQQIVLMAKPFTPIELASMVRRVLGRVGSA
jgi:CheY-like chemotaxis protein